MVSILATIRKSYNNSYKEKKLNRFSDCLLGGREIIVTASSAKGHAAGSIPDAAIATQRL